MKQNTSQFISQQNREDNIIPFPGAAVNPTVAPLEEGDFRNAETYEPVPDFDVDAFLAEGWETISQKGQGEEKEALPKGSLSEEPHEEEIRPKRHPKIHRPKTGKKKRKKLSAKRRVRQLIILVVIGAFLLAVGYSVHTIWRLKAEQKALLATQQELEQRKADLEQELENVEDLDYIEQQARERLHMVLPGEILYILPDSEE